MDEIGGRLALPLATAIGGNLGGGQISDQQKKSHKFFFLRGDLVAVGHKWAPPPPRERGLGDSSYGRRGRGPTAFKVGLSVAPPLFFAALEGLGSTNTRWRHRRCRSELLSLLLPQFSQKTENRREKQDDDDAHPQWWFFLQYRPEVLSSSASAG